MEEVTFCPPMGSLEGDMEAGHTERLGSRRGEDLGFLRGWTGFQGAEISHPHGALPGSLIHRGGERIKWLLSYLLSLG